MTSKLSGEIKLWKINGTRWKIVQNIDADTVVPESKVIILFSDAERLYCRFRFRLGTGRYGNAMAE